MDALTPTHFWIILGLLLIVAEIFTLSFFIFFFGIAALIVAGLRALNLLDNLPVEIVLFGALGFCGLLVFRKAILRNFHRARGVEIDRHTSLILSESIPPHGTVKIEYQGTLWDAYNDSDQALQRGQTVVIMGMEGIKLVVKPRSQGHDSH